jgi:hypothetical protein
MHLISLADFEDCSGVAKGRYFRTLRKYKNYIKVTKGKHGSIFLDEENAYKIIVLSKTHKSDEEIHAALQTDEISILDDGWGRRLLDIYIYANKLDCNDFDGLDEYKRRIDAPFFTPSPM